MSIKALDADLGAALLAVGKGLLMGGFAAGMAYLGLSERIEDKADATEVAVLIEREALHHGEVMRAIGRVEVEVNALRVEKADKP